MHHHRLLLVLTLWPMSLIAQVRTVALPARSYLMDAVRGWGRESPLGDLVSLSIPDSAVELRLWSGFGLWGTNGLVLQRSERGIWSARRVVVETCSIVVPHSERLTAERIDSMAQIARRTCPPRSDSAGQIISVDTLAVFRIGLPRNPNAVWRSLLDAGILTLPVEVPRPGIMTDGHTYILELRRGQDYRASKIEYMEKPQNPADATIKRVVELLSRSYRWDVP